MIETVNAHVAARLDEVARILNEQAIYQMLTSGRLPILERLRGEADPIQLLASVPGIGKVPAKRLHEELDIDTLEELEAASQDGRLADLAGFGEKRIQEYEIRSHIAWAESGTARSRLSSSSLRSAISSTSIVSIGRRPRRARFPRSRLADSTQRKNRGCRCSRCFALLLVI